MARVTLQTIADLIGVSRMTVSNAFSRPDQLSRELRERILAAARELGYAGPDPAGRALARGTTGAIGVLLTDSLHYAFTDEVATGFLSAVVDELAATGLALTLLTSQEHGKANAARDVAIDGALVYSCLPHSEARAWLSRRKLPLVHVDQDPVDAIASVNVDDRGGAQAAAQHLLELGHHDIAILTVASPGDGVAHPQQQRLFGWLDALSAAGVEPVVVEVPFYSDAEAEHATHHLLSSPQRPTGVLCFSDLLALGVIRAAHQLGLAVPDDLSVVGFDDSPIATRTEPSITTVRQDIDTKGRLAARYLTEALSAREAGVAHEAPHTVLPTELIVRQSTRPAA
jgi:DNA-binding LacI/PurR family transcriptional regulator